MRQGEGGSTPLGHPNAYARSLKTEDAPQWKAMRARLLVTVCYTEGTHGV